MRRIIKATASLFFSGGANFQSAAVAGHLSELQVCFFSVEMSVLLSVLCHADFLAAVFPFVCKAFQLFF